MEAPLSIVASNASVCDRELSACSLVVSVSWSSHCAYPFSPLPTLTLTLTEATHPPSSSRIPRRHLAMRLPLMPTAKSSLDAQIPTILLTTSQITISVTPTTCRSTSRSSRRHPAPQSRCPQPPPWMLCVYILLTILAVADLGLDQIYVRQQSVRYDKEGPSAGIETFWFESEGDRPIESPPDLTAQGDLHVGDLFYHRNTIRPKCSQLWIWIEDTAMGFTWKPVKIGHRHSDGRRLTLTEKRKNPSWIGEKWFVRRGVESTSYHPSLCVCL